MTGRQCLAPNPQSPRALHNGEASIVMAAGHPTAATSRHAAVGHSHLLLCNHVLTLGEGAHVYELYGFVNQMIGLVTVVFWVFVLAVAGIFLAKVLNPNRFAEASVIERWSAFLPGQAGSAKTYLSKVDESLASKNVPFGSRREKIAVSLMSDETYDFLVCKMNADCSAFISCVAVGTDLQVNWLIQDHTISGIYRLPILGPMLVSVMKRYSFANGNKVRAFASTTHACAVEAAEKIMDEARIDKGILNRKTSGRLGPL